MDFVKSEPPQNVIIAAMWQAGGYEDLGETINALYDAGVKSVTVVGPAPLWRVPLPEIIAVATTKDAPAPQYMSKDLGVEPFDVDADFKARAAGKPWLYASVLDTACRDTACLTRTGPGAQDIMQWDRRHFTASGSQYVVGRLSLGLE